MAERKKKAADQAVSETKQKTTRGRKPAAKVEQVEKPIESIEPVEKAVPAPEKHSYTVACQTVLNVRAGAGKQFVIVRQIPNGSDVTVSEQVNGWGNIGPDEWVMMEFLK